MMSRAALQPNDGLMQEDPHAWREEFRRRMAERGVMVRLPRAGATWEPPKHPLPIDADEMSRFVVELRRAGKL
jgi:hypothetical protein